MYSNCPKQSDREIQEQIVQVQIRLLPKEQSDLSLHCLPLKTFDVSKINFFKSQKYNCKARVPNIEVIYGIQ